MGGVVVGLWSALRPSKAEWYSDNEGEAWQAEKVTSTHEEGQRYKEVPGIVVVLRSQRLMHWIIGLLLGTDTLSASAQPVSEQLHRYPSTIGSPHKPGADIVWKTCRMTIMSSDIHCVI
jgi:hypothetical protein